MLTRLGGLGMLCLAALACAHDDQPQPAGAAPSSPPAGISREEACVRWKCRSAGILRLRTDKGIFEKDLQPTPYTDGELVQILPGESFAVTGDVEGDHLVRLRFVEGPPAARDVLLLTFEQKEMGGQPAMVLKVESRFPRTLKYRAGMVVPEHKGIHHTSSCPVLAGKFVWETWTNPIVVLVMRDFVFLPAQGSLRCD